MAGERLFERLRAAAGEDWGAYTGHAFVQGLADGTLPEASFRHYLEQDYLFLIHFARAYALMVYKAGSLAEMREAAAAVHMLINEEMRLHVDYCRGWGIDEAALQRLPEATANMAYTRFVLERGMAGDILDLQAALAPCVVGYGEIGARLHGDAATKRTGNPYLKWIETYGGADYQALVQGAVARLDRLAEERLTPARFEALAGTFRQATRLEVGFWEMGLHRLP